VIGWAWPRANRRANWPTAVISSRTGQSGLLQRISSLLTQHPSHVYLLLLLGRAAPTAIEMCPKFDGLTDMTPGTAFIDSCVSVPELFDFGILATLRAD